MTERHLLAGRYPSTPTPSANDSFIIDFLVGDVIAGTHIGRSATWASLAEVMEAIADSVRKAQAEQKEREAEAERRRAEEDRKRREREESGESGEESRGEEGVPEGVGEGGDERDPDTPTGPDDRPITYRKPTIVLSPELIEAIKAGMSPIPPGGSGDPGDHVDKILASSAVIDEGTASGILRLSPFDRVLLGLATITALRSRM
jgi:hypothetical protein